MAESLPLACADCQEILALDPYALDQPAIREHLASCPACSQLYYQYREIDKQLNQIPDLKALPDLSLRFQQLPQARHIAELDESFASWENMLEEKATTASMRSWPGEASVHDSLNQKEKTVQNPHLSYTTDVSSILNNRLSEQPLRPPLRAGRSLWRMVAVAVAVAVVLVNVIVWGVLPNLKPQSGGVGPGRTTSTPTATAATDQYTFTEQDSGRTVTFGITSRFIVTLDGNKYPEKDLQISCTDPAVASALANAPYATPPLYAVQYQTNAAGSCTIKNHGFILHVVVTSTSSTTPTVTPATSTTVPATATAVPATATVTPATSTTVPATATTTPATATTVPATPTLTQQYAFTAQDSGRTVTFGITSRFTVTLDGNTYPESNLQISCTDPAVASALANAPYATPPLYAVQYQTNEAGSCKISNGSFVLNVVVVQ